ncbi:MAG: glycine--tRNA ligase [Oligoflexia bacterium]|nr:glycine--tRNA ligase [Oligoflexia bacterium]MBF0367020.1 glycine--tRNA ligase [Oligoflexia bacterium]
MSEKNLASLNDLASMAKRRGFLFQSSEIYGGLGGCWDYGPLGIELKNNVKERWWKSMTYRSDIEGIDASILMNATVWEASGHVENFFDPMVDCKKCKSRFRADKVDLTAACPVCGTKGEFTEARNFNLMFKTQVGAVEDSSAVVYLRPETAQGIFVNFLNVQGTMRQKLPFGIAQIGKAFRNEITPGNFIFRLREFEQMEMQYFVAPGTQLTHFEAWKELRMKWHLENGIRKEKLRYLVHEKLAHYADHAVDIEYEFPGGWEEMEGIHSRTDFDLRRHQEYSKKNLQYVDQSDGNKKFIPYVVETSAGCDRSVLAVMCDAYRVEFPGDPLQERVVMRFHKKIAPIKMAVLPLMKKPELEAVADKIYQEIQKSVKSEYDTSGSIGKRYRRQDEIGTPYCATIDYDSLTDHKITIRDRDSMKQERVAIDQIDNFLKDNL